MRTAARGRRSAVAAFAVLALVLGALVAAPPAVAADAAAAEPVTVNVVTLGDLHGRIEQQLPYGPGGGVAELATAFRFQDIDWQTDSIIASVGDNIGASPYVSAVQRDEPTIDTLGSAGLEVSAIGTGEFVRGRDDFAERIVPRASFPHLAANVYDEATGRPAFEEYWITEREGIRVAFIGALTRSAEAGLAGEGLIVRDIPSEVNRVAATLSDDDETNGEAEVVVALVHEGATSRNEAELSDPTTPLGYVVTSLGDDVDMIAAGGTTHLTFAHAVDGRPVVQAGQYGEFIWNTFLTYDPATGEVDAGESWGTPMWERTVSGAWALYGDDAAVAAEVDAAVEAAETAGAETIAPLDADIVGGRQGVDGEPGATEPSAAAESTLGNLVADATLALARRFDPEVEIALVEPTSLGADLVAGADGTVTAADVAAVQPNARPLVALTLTGAQVREVLREQQVSPDATVPFHKLGVSKHLSYLGDRASGEIVRDVWVQGEPLNDDRAYRIAVNAELATGAHGFATLAAGFDRRMLGVSDLDAVFAVANADALVADYAQRSIDARWSAAPAGGHPAGSQIDIELASLDFTGPEPRAERVDASIGGIPAGSATVDSALTRDTDETGVASVAAIVPEGLDGTVPLVLTTATGTRFEVPIEVSGTPTTGEPVVSRTAARPDALVVPAGGEVGYTVQLSSARGVPAGTVEIYDGTRRILTVPVAADVRGRVHVSIPALAPGVHKLWARFAGSAAHLPSKSPGVPIVVR